MSAYRLDTAALHQALDVVRRYRGLTWRDIAAETGLSPSTLTRLVGGHGPDADGLVTLLAWLGHTDTIRPFIVGGPEINNRGPSTPDPDQ